jgi:hypothetical protein
LHFGVSFSVKLGFEAIYFCKAVWAAAKRAMGTRKGLQLT